MYDLIFFDIETYSPQKEGPTLNDKVITIAYAVNDDDPNILLEWKSSEKGVLKCFIQEVSSRDRPILIGHNIFRFDIPTIVSRAFEHQMGTVWELNSIFVRNLSVDTLQCLLPSNNLYFNGLGLTNCAERLGMENTTYPGDLIYKYYQDKKWQAIISHNLNDVEITRQLYYKLREADFIPF